MALKIKKINRQEVITSLPSGALLVVNDPAKRRMQNITVPNLLADSAFAITIINKIVATETSIADFAAASAGYTFQQGDLIQLAPDADSNILTYYYGGGTKTNTASYSLIETTKVEWASVINKPVATDVTAAETSIADFAAASAGYTFEQWSVVRITDANGNYIYYQYNGGTKTDVTSYVFLGVYPRSLSLIDSSRTIYDLTDVLAADFDARELYDAAGLTKIDFSHIVDITGNVQQDLGDIYYKSSTVGDEVNDIRYYDNAGVFIIEKCTVVGATKGAGTWVEIFNSSTNVGSFASAAEVLARTVSDKAVSPATIDGGVKRYKALISQNAPVPTKTSGTVPVGSIWTITTFAAGDDFSNWELLSGTGNTSGDVYRATTTAPTVWANGSDLAYDGSPYVVSKNSLGQIRPLENTLGEEITFTYEGVGYYGVKSNSKFISGRTFYNISHSSGDIGILTTSNKIEYVDIDTIDLASGTGVPVAFSDDIFYLACIFIEVYP
jgi:hypothetical protein